MCFKQLTGQGRPIGACPYRSLDQKGHQVAWVNEYLDAQHIRQLSPRSLRAYAYDLLYVGRISALDRCSFSLIVVAQFPIFFAVRVAHIYRAS